MKSKGSWASRCVQALRGSTIESTVDVHYQLAAADPANTQAPLSSCTVAGLSGAGFWLLQPRLHFVYIN